MRLLQMTEQPTDQGYDAIIFVSSLYGISLLCAIALTRLISVHEKYLARREERRKNAPLPKFYTCLQKKIV